MSKSQPTSTSITPERHDTDDLKDTWTWSEGVTKTVTRLLRSPSLKVCTGNTPACDHNLDKDPLDGVTMQADAFNLPYRDCTFETTVSDPPWLAKSTEERRRLFEEVLRVTKPGGLIIYNATWIPENERATVRDQGFRQEGEFWGNQSFLLVYQKTPTDSELLEMYDVDSDRRLSPDDFGGNAPWQDVDPEYLTDPRIVTPHNEFRCPECGCSKLGQHRDVELSGNYRWELYQCMNPHCGFRPMAEEIYEAREQRLSSEGVDVSSTSQQKLSDLSQNDPPTLQTDISRYSPSRQYAVAED
ncbi:methyltransferase domain-containing protein [Halorubrum sp. ASP1]|uniref:class I SAM-dependent methyltransferase n=1 Tax=Halorubrum sp. ASP1 TaxID=2518114 RepID=UPI0010F69060|nr:methyltransferase domain-containing protein [Halorubrum sp. ASP1]TKX60667.1 methyltransferase domain-containing protein [Halorubrum sp. ASP1]